MRNCARIGKLALTVLLLGWSLTAAAQIYRWVDERGVVNFSDRPVAGAEMLSVQVGTAWYRVEHVYDGDTVRFRNGMKVRLSGLNTPEVANHQRRGEAGGEAAKTWLKQQIGTGKVRLEPSRERQDKYDRYLGYLFTEHGVHLNVELVRQGLATVNLHPPNLRYAKPLIRAQLEAERQQRGLWALPEYQPRTVEEAINEPRRGWQRIQGQVQTIRYTRRYARLQLAENFDARIPKELLDYFPPLERYEGRQIELRGWISRRKTYYSVLIRHPSAVRIIVR